MCIYQSFTQSVTMYILQRVPTVFLQNCKTNRIKNVKKNNKKIHEMHIRIFFVYILGNKNYSIVPKSNTFET
jgi:hypothetical protein